MPDQSVEKTILQRAWPLGWLMLAALGLRLFRLDFRSIWLDEAYSLKLAAANWHGIIHGASMDIHPPLYHLLLGGWIRLFGSSEFAARSLSAVLGALLVPAAFKLGETLAGRKAGWWSAALVAVSPYFVELSRSARMGALLALCAALSLYFFLQVIQGRGVGFAVGYWAFTLAALYTHYFGFLLLFAQTFFLFVGIKQLKLSHTVRTRWLYLQLLLFGGFAPWLPSFLQHAQKGGPSWRGLGASWLEPVHSLYTFVLGTACWTRADKAAALICLAAALAILLWELLPVWQRLYALLRPRHWGLVLTVIAVPLAVVWVYSWSRLNVFDNRYLSFVALLLLVVLAAALSRVGRQAAIVSGVLILLAFLVPLRNQYFVYGYYDNWRAAAGRLAGQVRAHERVAVFPPWNETPLRYYLPNRIPIQGLPGTYDPITGETADYFYIDRESAHQLQSTLADQRFWLVLVNDGEQQSAIREELLTSFRRQSEAQLGSISIGLYESSE